MKRENLASRLPVLITAVVCVGLYLAAGMHFDKFFRLRVLTNLFSDNSFVGIIAIGETFVILTGGIDLSVGAMLGCSSIMAASLLLHTHLPAPAVFTITLAFGLLFGTAQGFLISRFKLAPFLVTLAGLFFCRGVSLMISHESLAVSNPMVDKLTDFSLPLAAGATLRTTALVFFLVLAAGVVLAKQTPFGRAIYAIGGNEKSANLMGLKVSRTLVGAYALCGFCAALGGLVFTLYTSSGNAISGLGMELDAISAVVIGGTLLTGGYGSVFGTFLGVTILGLVQTMITFQGTLSSWWTKIVIGFLLLVFLLVQKGIEWAAVRKR